MKFAIELLRDLIYETLVHEEEVGTSRWANEYEAVFEHEGKLYGTSYRRGTGDEGERPFQYESDKEIECPEMERYEKTVVAYREKKPDEPKPPTA